MKKIKILNWNVRGLEGREKCNGVRNVIRASRCDVCCMQKTKLNEFSLIYLACFLPSYFEKSCVYIQSFNSNGGCIISWRKSYSLISSWATQHTCTAILMQTATRAIFTVTNAYGPSEDNQKKKIVHEGVEGVRLTSTAHGSSPEILTSLDG